ncbi:hypothetical protein BC937DRAFT_90940 [Endogone sp. FLAS-F59071]|nr:hypothetical protein BC937DRAFT_90940 [Endogone sp. FLAS-F59071]|eukprot:RUS16670.1 hypothetical protein BC937DRAFT_90940 [Endogone sp. FLAS-F59071]
MVMPESKRMCLRLRTSRALYSKDLCRTRMRQLIEEVLSVMYEHLIMDQEVSRSLKTVFFNNYILDQVCRKKTERFPFACFIMINLLHFAFSSPIQLTKIYTRKDPDLPTEPAKIPADVVHHFLIAICCTPGVGVCFHDASWYPPSVIAQPAATAGGDVGAKNVKIHNKILSKYVTSLRPTDDLRQQELLLKILKACPELVQVYWQSTSLTFDPRLSSKWLANMTLLHKTISLPIPSLYFPLTQSYPTTAPPVHVIIDNILPTCVSRPITSKALQHASPLVKYTTTVVLATAFQKLGRVLDRIGEIAAELDEMQDERAAMQFDTDAADAQPAASVRWCQVAQNVRDEMRRRVPDVQLIVSLQHQISSLMPKAMKSDEVSERRAQQQVLHEATLRLIRYYQQHLPEAMMESKFDFGKLVPSDLVGVKAGPLMHLLELLLVLPDFKWANKAADSSTSHLTTILTLYLSTHYTHVRHLVQRILHKLLSESVLFQHDANEVCFWLEALPRNLLLSGFVGTETAGVLTEDQKNVLQFLDDCIGRCLKTPYRYVDDLASLVTTVNKRIQPEQDLPEEMDVDTPLTAMDKLRTTAASALRNSAVFAHPFSPLLVTLIEQYPYMREHSPAAAAPVARFITRLIKGLLGKLGVVGYLDECVRRVAEVVGIEGADKECRIWDAEDWDEKCIFTGLRNYFKGLISASVNEVVGKRDGKNSDLIISKTAEESLLDLLKNFDPLNLQAARSGILSLLARMPVPAIDKYLVDIADHCKKNLAWSNFEPLIEYLDIRHPFARNLFEYSDFSRFLNAKDEDIPSPLPIVTLLLHIPFATLFFNINPLLMASSKIVKLLQHSIQHIPEDHISPACNHIILLLSATLAHHGHRHQESHEIVLVTIRTCFILLKDLLKAAQANEAVYSALKEVVFGQSVLKELFLVRAQIEADEISTENNLTKLYLEALDQDIVDLIFKVFRTDAPRTRTSRIDESLWRPYKQKVVDAILDKLSQIENKMAGISALDHTIISLFPHFANFCNEEDLASILNQLLRFDFDWLFSTAFSNGIQRFNSMLSEVLRRLSKVTSSGSTISPGSFKVLVYLWQSHPSPELDTLIYEFLEVSLPPNVLGCATYQHAETSTIDISLSEQRLFGTLPGGMEPTIVTFILNRINLTRAKILSLLIVGDPRYRTEFVKCALGNKKFNQQLKLPEMTIVVNAFSIAVSMISTDSNILWRQSATEDDKSLVAYFLKHMSSPFLSVIYATPSSLFDRHDFLLEASTLTRLVELSPPIEFSLLVLNIAKERGAFLLSLDSLRVVEATLKITIEQEKKDRFLRAYIQEILKSVTELVNTDKLQSSTEVDRVFRKLVSIGTTSSTSLISLNSDIVRNFVFAILLDRFSETSIIEFTIFLISCVYKQHQKDEPIQTYLRMAIEHKDFEQLTIPPTLSQKSFAPTPESTHRLALIKLIHVLARIRPSVTTKHSSHIDSLLSSYGATIALADRLILNFLVTVERHSRVSIVTKVMLWGPGSSKARNLNAQRASLISSSASTIAESLALLDPLMLVYSYARFPITRSFLNKEQDVNDEESAAPTYDPAFLLPLFSSLMAYGNQLDCRKFIETNALGYVVVAMSSLEGEVRKVAYFLMDEFYILLGHATFREKKQILLLLDSLKNAIADSNDKDVILQRIPTIITVFVAHALGILLQPAHFMYPHVNKFLLQRPFIDLEDIPMFYSLFNTSSFSLKKDRVWILRLLSAGVKCPEDYKLFKRRHVWDIISSYYNSQIADSITRSIVIEILFNITAIPITTIDLLTHSGLLTFFHNMAVTATHAEYIIFTARLLLRTLLSAHERYDRLRWLGSAYLYQSASIATALIHATEQLTVSKAEATVLLITVLDILKIFHYIALISVADKPEANVGTSTFTPYHAKKIVNMLRKCEPYVELIRYRQSKPICYLIPSGTDALDSLYRSPIALPASEMYGQIVEILLELMVQGEGFARDQEGSFKFAAARALAFGAEEKIGLWVMECLGEAR